MPIEKRRGISGSPCSPPSAWVTVHLPPESSCCKWKVDRRQQHKWEQQPPIPSNLLNMGRPQNVIERSDSVNAQNSGCGTGVRAARRKCPTQSVPARVRAALERCTFLLEMRTECLVATRRTPPSFFTSAVNPYKSSRVSSSS